MILSLSLSLSLCVFLHLRILLRRSCASRTGARCGCCRQADESRSHQGSTDLDHDDHDDDGAAVLNPSQGQQIGLSAQKDGATN